MPWLLSSAVLSMVDMMAEMALNTHVYSNCSVSYSSTTESTTVSTIQDFELTTDGRQKQTSTPVEAMRWFCTQREVDEMDVDLLSLKGLEFSEKLVDLDVTASLHDMMYSYAGRYYVSPETYRLGRGYDLHDVSPWPNTSHVFHSNQDSGVQYPEFNSEVEGKAKQNAQSISPPAINARNATPKVLRSLPMFKPWQWVLASAVTTSAHPVSNSNDTVNPSWGQRALESLKEIVLLLTRLPVPLAVIGSTGWGAYWCYEHKASGKAAFGIAVMAVVYARIRPSPSSTTTTTTTPAEDAFTEPTVGLAYTFFAITYCRLVVEQNGGSKVFYAGAGLIATVMTFLFMANEPLSNHWIQLTGLDPMFLLAIAMPLTFFLCDVAIYVSGRLRAYRYVVSATLLQQV